MKVERTVLQSIVIPKLKAYCAKKKWQFECIDLRWGVSSEAQNTRKTIKICLNEIKHCQDISPKPNFIVMTGQRYGWIPLPNELEYGDFNILYQSANNSEREIITFWYEYIAGKYILKPNHAYDETIHKKEFCFKKAEHIMSKLTQRVAQYDYNFAHRYCLSATEQEIWEGLFSQEELADNTVYYDRTLSHIPDNKRKIFIDESPQLQSLKKHLHNYVTQENIYIEDITFDEYNNELFTQKFAENMYSYIRRIIDREIEAHVELDDFQIEHIFQHGIYTSNYISLFNANSEQLYSGGKNILVIQKDKQSRECPIPSCIIADSKNVFFRALGKSSLSSNGRCVFMSFLKEYNVPFHQTDSIYKLIDRIRDFYVYRNSQCYSSTPPQTIILDSVDKLSADDILFFFTWFADRMPVKLVLTLSDDSCLKYLPKVRFTVCNASVGKRLLSKDEFLQKLDIVSRPENNNSQFVRLVLGLLCFSHSGVTEDELLEICTLDKEFFNSLKSSSDHEIPHIDGIHDRTPYSLWSILYYQISDILVMRHSVGAVTYVPDNDIYKQYIIDFIGNDLFGHITDLLIKYFEQDTNFDNVRTLDELPYHHIQTKRFDNLTRLLKELDFCQKMIVHGLHEDLIKFITIAKLNSTDDAELTYLANLSDFICCNLDLLLKYSKFNKTFLSIKFKSYLAGIKTNSKYKQTYRLFRTCSSSSRITGQYALVVNYADREESLCEIIDTVSGQTVAMQYIPVHTVRTDMSVTYGQFENSELDTKQKIVRLYDWYGYITTWHYESGLFECQPCDGNPFGHPYAFSLPDDFDAVKNEDVIASGKIDDCSFYVVTCYSLFRFTL